ncbi:hypothetical protein BX616_009122, partial [Lobosporangium transversale]
RQSELQNGPQNGPQNGLQNGQNSGPQQNKQQQPGQQHNGQNKAMQNVLEKKIGQLQETIVRMQQEQLQLAQTNQMLMSIVIQMLSKNMGITVPKEQLMAVGLSADTSRSAMKSKKGQNSSGLAIPDTNETLAAIMALMGPPRAAEKTVPLPSKPVVIIGQSSKPSLNE